MGKLKSILLFLFPIIGDLLDEAYDKGYTEAEKECPDCENCDERIGEPEYNEGRD